MVATPIDAAFIGVQRNNVRDPVATTFVAATDARWIDALSSPRFQRHVLVDVAVFDDFMHDTKIE
jgi:hypothetical protein